MATPREEFVEALKLLKELALKFLGVWEQMNNNDFKVVEFDHFKVQAGLLSFVLSPSQWIGRTNLKIFTGD